MVKSSFSVCIFDFSSVCLGPRFILVSYYFKKISYFFLSFGALGVGLVGYEESPKRLKIVSKTRILYQLFLSFIFFFSFFLLFLLAQGNTWSE